MDHLAALTALLKGPSSCVDGACGVCMGVKPGDPLTFGLQFGVSVAQCNNAAATRLLRDPLILELLSLCTRF